MFLGYPQQDAASDSADNNASHTANNKAFAEPDLLQKTKNSAFGEARYSDSPEAYVQDLPFDEADEADDQANA